MTEVNEQGTPLPPTEKDGVRICTACQLGIMLQSGAIVGTYDAGHSQCEGTRLDPCGCGCEFARRHQCKECGRKKPSGELDDKGQCVDRRDCANAILAAHAASRAERAKRASSAPPARTNVRAGVGGPAPACKCDCGETTGGGNYRPGHDARHVSKLTAAVKSGELTLEAALPRLPSDKLRDKLAKAVG